jgi:hypothetical protein
MMENTFKSIDTIMTGAGSIILINWFGQLPIETVYSLFVQSLVATATIGKLLADWANSKKK